jgi:2-hydroxy-3-keto-5-methylthiopentenyl-1-phosphate phosphatase
VNADRQVVLKELFSAGDLRDAAICIDHYVNAVMSAIQDEEVAAVIVAAGMSIMGILSSIERGRSVEDVTAAIDDASKRAMAEVMLDMLDWAMRRSGGAVL